MQRKPNKIDIQRSKSYKIRIHEFKLEPVNKASNSFLSDTKYAQTVEDGFGVYILTREKSNSVLLAEKSLDWDKEDPRNKGVQADEVLLNGAGIRMRRVTYEDPVRGKTYRFITNELTLPPGIIAFLYKKRWDIEKIFDELKNKLEEKKAWGQSMEAKKQQAHFICLTHNLMQILKEKLEKEEEIIDRTNESKRRKRIAEEKSQAHLLQFEKLIYWHEKSYNMEKSCWHYILQVLAAYISVKLGGILIPTAFNTL